MAFKDTHLKAKIIRHRHLNKSDSAVCYNVSLFTEVVDDAPVRFRNSEPLAVSRTDVDVY